MVDQQSVGCPGCRDGGRERLDFDFTMAFQPIVDLPRRSVYAQEALVRGLDGSGAGAVLSKVNEDNRYAFDQKCRTKAIEVAHSLGLNQTISINFMPNAVYEPKRCIMSTLASARAFDWPIDRIVFEFTEGEQIDVQHLKNIFKEYKNIGFRTAIDDFGAGFAGLKWLADLSPDIVKIDMDLIRDIDTDETRQVIIRGLVRICNDLGVTVIAEGVETQAELETLQDAGIHLFQGYLLAKPSLGKPADIAWPLIAA